MKWVIDRMEEDIAIIENIETREKKEVAVCLLPSSIHEGSVLIFENNTYQVDIPEEIKRRTEILKRFQKLRSTQD